MKTKPSKLFLIICGAFIFNAIFWQEKLGINLLLFDMFICISVFKLFPSALKNNASKQLLVAQVFTLAMVVIQNTLLSKIAFSISLLLFISFSLFSHRSVWFAGGSILLNFIEFIPNFFREFKNHPKRNNNFFSKLRSMRIFIIPIAILSAFFIIYSFANTIFSNIATSIGNTLLDWFTHLFDWFSLERFGFFLLGIFIVGGLILRSKNSYFSSFDLKCQDDLVRQKNRLKKWIESSFADLLQIIIGKTARGIMALRSEYKIGIISLILLNVLLLFINILDVKYVWLGIGVIKNSTLSGYVHEGAGLLIISIILAMVVLLFFFRGNLNFYKKNKWLMYGAYLWIFQNLFLVLSVFNRDYFYIVHYGLAYKRLGLLFFLVMVLAGLITIFFKIYFKKTNYFLLRINAWILIIFLILASSINWDVTMAQYNLARKSTIPVDVPFLLSLSDKTLPLLQKNKEIFEKNYTVSNQYYFNGAPHNAIEFFEYRKKDFLERQNHYAWLSWNVADAIVKKDLTGNNQLLSIKLGK